jgi:hypothetical protein
MQQEDLQWVTEIVVIELVVPNTVQPYWRAGVTRK